MEGTFMKYLILILMETILASSSNSSDGDFISLLKKLTAKLKTLDQKVGGGTENVKKQLVDRKLIPMLDDIERKIKMIIKSIPGSKKSKPEYKFEERFMSRRDAGAACSEWGGHLAAINSKKENDYVWKEMKKRGFHYLWIDADGYSNWEAGDPDLEPCTHPCVLMSVSYGEWFEYDCDDTNRSICERRGM